MIIDGGGDTNNDEERRTLKVSDRDSSNGVAVPKLLAIIPEFNQAPALYFFVASMIDLDSGGIGSGEWMRIAIRGLSAYQL